MPALPTGTVTFLYTDIEGSTARWEQHPAAMRAAVDRQTALLHQAIEHHHGQVFRTVGDGLCAAFASAADAVAAALAAQQALLTEPWGALGLVPTRLVLHTCLVDRQGGDYVGSGLNRLGRLLGIGYGGQVLLTGAVHLLVRDSLPPAASLRDLGEHRLRDLVQPERVFQLLHPDLPADFPPLRSLDAFPHNLPLQLTSLVGREQEVATVTALLGQTRLLTLTGAGGCGKTRLALQVAAEVLEDYADGVWFVDLAPLADPDLVGRTVAGVLGIAEQPGQTILTTLVSVLRQRALLLVLDNCEHLLDASAGLAEAVLRGCPGLRVLATSRELLSVSGEVAWRVPSLATPDPQQLPPLAPLAAMPAVRLFVDRAWTVQPTFALTAANAAAVAQVCRRLDGMPLAIELAAARLTALSPAQIAARLDDRFRLLTGGRRTAVRRQQTLQAAIDWSHDLLTEAERILLRRLSVFAGGWTLEAAEAVCSDDGLEVGAVLDLLTQLVEKSLVVAEAGDETRYRLLETVRQYAGDKLLTAGEAQSVRDRHLVWAVALAEAAEPALRSADQIAWMERLAVEHDNIRAALAWARERAEAELALRLVASLWHFWEVRGYYWEARSHYDTVLVMPGAEEPTRARALALCGLTLLTTHMSDFKAAEAMAEEAVAISLPLGAYDLAAIAHALHSFALALQGEYSAARRHADEGERLADAGQAPWSRAFALRNGGFIALMEGDQSALRRSIERRLPIVRLLGNPWLEHSLYADMSQLAYDGGDYDAARAYREQNLALARAIGTPRSIAGATSRLAAIALNQGDRAAARTHLGVALRLFRDLGNRWEVPGALEVGAGLAAADDRPLRAVRLAGAAAGVRATLGMSARPGERSDLDRWLAPTRAMVTTEAYAEAFAAGQALTLEAAVAEALAEDEANPPVG